MSSDDSVFSHAAWNEVADDEANQTPILMQYWRILLRWRWMICGIVMAAVVAGLIITLLATPKYTATSTIEISRQQDKIVNVQEVRSESSAADMEFYQTQYALLRARTLAERVVADLKLAEDERFLQMFDVDLGQGLFSDKQTKRLTPAERAERMREASDILLEHIGIDPIRGSRLVDVNFTSPDPAFSQRVVNAWTQHFIELTLARRFEATSYARKFLEERLEQLRVRLEQSERQLVGYASNQQIITIPTSGTESTGGERSIVAQDLATINQALALATAQRVQAGSRLSDKGTRGGISVEALENSAISGLRQKRAEAASDYARLLVQFEPEYPAALALSRQVQELDRAIVREEGRVGMSLRNAYSEAVDRENELRSKVEGLKSDLLDLRRRSIQYNIYQRDVDTNRQLYDGLLQRYKEIGVAGGVGTNNIAIVDPAQLPERPSAPSLPLNLLLALFLGFTVAALVTVALEQIDEAVKDPSELARAIGMPLLGTIPHVEDGNPAAQLLDRKSSVSEAYLSLQTNLQFSTDHGVPRSLAVTSTRAAEGKSTTSYAIAQSLARTHRSVVLVDCDMRSPSIHEMAGHPNIRGVSNYLAGDDTIDAMLLRSETSDVVILPAGPLPPNAAELLTGPRLGALIEHLQGKFDHVIIDSPPVLGLADAPLIASKVEGVIYAVQANSARASMVRTALQRLLNANTTVLGAVLTKFEARKAHLGYGYDYGYGYGQQNPADQKIKT